jgi:tetratricopeptide (TPR) repeat protein
LVDFKKLLGKERITAPTDPLTIFDNLDKQVGKENRRQSQESVLKDWYAKFRAHRDVIVKLHTGQGKTLVGLLMLQSFLNEGKGPVAYVCPNSFLVSQTLKEARAFGFRTTQFVESKPPKEFLNSEAILVMNCSKIFNGKSVFGVVGSQLESIHLGAIVIDDAHKCIDIIRNQFSITIERKVANPAYRKLWGLFEETLTKQAPGTTADIARGLECLIAVPFWSWFDKRKDVLDILSEYRESKELLFVWDLLKDRLHDCICIFSGSKVEIAPRLLPVDMIPSFTKADRRIFLSATLNEDAFLVRDLGISPQSVANPLSSGDVKYSGERLILLPSLVDPSLNRQTVISWVNRLCQKHGDFGVVAIVPSFPHTNDWKDAKAEVTNVKDLHTNIEKLRAEAEAGDAKHVLVLVNEYDGVDLPDSTCRILCLDSLPSYSSLMDRYLQDMRPTSGAMRRQLAQRVEQGMGRAIRGSSDWCIVVVTGNNLTDFLSQQSKRAFLSNEAQMQIKIGEQLASELKSEGGQLVVVERLVNQCLKRNIEWKEYYRQKMTELEPDVPHKSYLDRALLERKAEILLQQRNLDEAVSTLETLIQSVEKEDKADVGWLLQLKATYLYPSHPTRAIDTQLKAYKENFRLFRPDEGITYSKLTGTTGTRASRILEWIQTYAHDSYTALILNLTKTTEKLTFSSPSDSFEEAIDELGRALGFVTQRPEKVSGKGPDNLWHIQGEAYWVIECKNEVLHERTEITKREVGQLNNAIGWFREIYEKDSSTPVLIHPAELLAHDAYPAQPSFVIGQKSLKELKENTLKFYNSLAELRIDNISQGIIRDRLHKHGLDTNELTRYLHRLEQRTK